MLDGAVQSDLSGIKNEYIIQCIQNWRFICLLSVEITLAHTDSFNIHSLSPPSFLYPATPFLYLHIFFCFAVFLFLNTVFLNTGKIVFLSPWAILHNVLGTSPFCRWLFPEHILGKLFIDSIQGEMYWFYNTLMWFPGKEWSLLFLSPDRNSGSVVCCQKYHYVYMW